MEHDDVTGSIEVGKYADMIVLDRNPFEIIDAGEVNDISEINVRRTVFEGETVYELK
jgi:predicted amidohydrolase YtcJ